MSSPLSPRGRGAYQAFTLIELLTVIAVIGILAAITIGVTQGVTRQGRIARAKAELGTLSTALEEYKRYYGDYLWVDATDETADVQINPGGTFNAATTDRAFNFFRALNGRLGPRHAVITRRIAKTGNPPQKYGKAFINPALFALERDAKSDQPAPDEPLPIPNTASSGNDPDFSNAILDPWGNRYLYYYKDLDAPNDWRGSQYILFSAGPDGLVEFPSAADLKAGKRPDPAEAGNVDNIYATP